MALLVTGGAGVIGTQLCKHLRASGIEIVSVDIADNEGVICADLRDVRVAERIFQEYHPEIVLHLAANKNVFFCEENPDESRLINFGITETLSLLCSKYGARMVFLSSDYVFGEENRVWHEADVPCPTTQYGRDKVASEKLIQNVLSDYTIVRTAGLYGFPSDLVQVVKSTLSKDEIFRAFENLVNCPTWTQDLFAMIDVILKEDLTGTFHCVGPEALSRYEYARKVATCFGLDESHVKAERLDFSKDVRPPALRLNGTVSYERLGIIPGRLEDNLRRIGDG